VRSHILNSREKLNKVVLQRHVEEAYALAVARPSGDEFTILTLVGDEQWWIAMHPVDHRRMGTGLKGRVKNSAIVEDAERRSDNLSVYRRR
jgi:hypothetical protein